MPIYHIEHECNGHTEQSPHGVELAGLAEVTAYAIATARLFQNLIPGERRECAFKVRDTSEGSRLNINLSLCLESAEPATDDIDGGLLD